MKWLAFALLLPTPLAAQSPPAAFYVGLYRIIGFDDAGPVDTLMRIDADGQKLIVSICGTKASMVLPSQSGDDHYVSAVIGDLSLTCDPFMTYENYPLLACYGDGQSVARLTMWPTDIFSEPLNCVD